MIYHVLVAEPSNDIWTAIALGVRQYRREATILRVEDGEQALRSLFQRGLMMEEPETPQLIVLNAELPIVPLNILIAQIRQHPRTSAIPLIVIARHASNEDLDTPSESQQWLHREPGIITITGTQKLEREVTSAIRHLNSNPSPSLGTESTEHGDAGS